jgi:hypothetical protein
VLIHPSDTAPIENSFPIDGNATFTDDDINGPINEAIVMTISAARVRD